MNDSEHKQALPSGFRLQSYHVVDVLGVGGFGVTYLGEHSTLGHRVAIKEYLPNEFAIRDGATVHPKSQSDREDFEWGLTRFLDEAKTLARFEHRNLVRVRDYFEANHTAYIVMDYEDGESLDRLLDRHGTLSEAQLRRVLLPIIDGLRQVHAAGFLHRDIKPSNIYVRRADETPVLLDFGAARQALGRKSKSMTAVASVGYSPPEQYESDGDQGPWTDIYALSALCYRAITGKAPIEAPRRQSRMLNTGADPLPLLTDSVEDHAYSQPLLKAVDQGLRIIVKERPQGLDEWVVLLDSTSSLGSTIPKLDMKATDAMNALQVEPDGHGVVRRRKSRAGAIFGIAAVAVLGVAVGLYFWSDSGGGLQVLGGRAMLVVETEPAGVEVLIGDKVVGHSPLERNDISPGTHILTLRHPLYETVRLENQILIDHRVLRIEERLIRGTGALTVVTEPRNAWIELDGERLATGTPVTLEGLPLGPVDLMLGAEEHRSVQVQVEISKDDVSSLQKVLERVPYGTLTLDVVPPDASGELQDIKPAHHPGIRLPDGQYWVKVRQQGYRELTQIIHVTGDTRERIELAVIPWKPKDTFVDTLITGGEGPEMVVIPAGRFRMGDLASVGDDNEKPVHEVMIRQSFALSKYEITFAQWDACVADGGCNGYRPDDEGWGRGSRPVINVNWEDAQSYVDWLSARTAVTVTVTSMDDSAQEYMDWLPARTNQVYRLPSEAEWEYAVRAGTTTIYHFGDDKFKLCRYANHIDMITDYGVGNTACSDGDANRTAEVGQYQPNTFNLYDMLGNVGEWVQDCWNGSYDGAPSNDMAWEQGNCEKHVMRGGTWSHSPRELRAAYRYGVTTGIRSGNLGFRVVRTLTP